MDKSSSAVKSEKDGYFLYSRHALWIFPHRLNALFKLAQILAIICARQTFEAGRAAAAAAHARAAAGHSRATSAAAGNAVRASTRALAFESSGNLHALLERLNSRIFNDSLEGRETSLVRFQIRNGAARKMCRAFLRRQTNQRVRGGFLRVYRFTRICRQDFRCR